MRSVKGETLMLASSQGDSSLHFFLIGTKIHHLGSFLVDGVGDTDGVHYVPGRLGRQYPLGLLVVQNGEAPEPRILATSTGSCSTALPSFSISISGTR